MNQPWLNEPDKVTWTDPDTQLLCAIHRHPNMKHLCGYVNVGKEHTFAEDFDVHGGVTFNASFEDEPDAGNWIGFDCAHQGDLIPGMSMSFQGVKTVYRDINYVRAECTKLAKQLSTRMVTK